MNKLIVIGDLHGDIDIYREIKDKFKDYDKILVGDYVDSFNKTRKQQLLLIEEILQDIEQNKVIALKGNHELSYLYPDTMGASGYASSFAASLMPLFSDMHRLLKPYELISEHKILITHAGLTKRLIPYDSNVLDDMNLLTLWLDQEIRNLDHGMVYNIGSARGGANPVGGIFWCDYQWDFDPIEGIRQVFGHTPGSSIRQRGENYCIDCLQSKKEVLEISEDGEIKTIEF
ncbi:MAG: metallophosphoesterase [Candidatus Omnitrophica bacterium]|jgi:hypothetical protein|nr:metallophosphoesterase [Candidatus Omnitrophota bacterium]